MTNRNQCSWMGDNQTTLTCQLHDKNLNFLTNFHRNEHLRRLNLACFQPNIQIQLTQQQHGESSSSNGVGGGVTSSSSIISNSGSISHGVISENIKDIIISGCSVDIANLHKKLVSVKIHGGHVANLKLNVVQRWGDLKEFELCDIGMEAFQQGFFCPLYSLKYLNLTGNRIADVKTISGDCNHGIETIDLSRNVIRTLSNDGLSYFHYLETLILHDNHIYELKENSFRGVPQLSSIDLSYNRIKLLPNVIFKSTSKLRLINLRNNTITSLPHDIFDGLHELQSIDLSQNALVQFSLLPSQQQQMPNIISINLGYNALTTLPPTIERLEILNLEHNKLRNLTLPIVYPSLRRLILSSNQLTSIHDRIFSNVNSIEQIFFDSNLISFIANDSFLGLHKLNEISLNDNRLSTVPVSINYLPLLSSLDLGNNYFKKIGRKYFEMSKLLGLRLAGNSITSIEDGSFVKLRGLQVLNLASNMIEKLDDVFAPLQSLMALRLDSNQIRNISNNILSNLSGLVYLNISDNRIDKFDYHDLPAKLEWLEIRQNRLKSITNYYNIASQLTHLDLSQNEIVNLTDIRLTPKIKTVLMQKNRVLEIPVGFFTRYHTFEKIDLQDNLIRKMHVNSLSLSKSSRNTPPSLYLAGNPLHCDCTLEWMIKLSRIQKPQDYPILADFNKTDCTMEMRRGDPIRRIEELHTNDFLCGYTAHCFALCHCCEFDACDCKMTCPDGCRCYYDHIWSTNIVNCGSSLYTHIPERIPMDATAIYLDGNNFGELTNHVFIGKKRLEQLYLNSSNIRSLQNRTFYGLSSLKVLNLQHNEIKLILPSYFDLLTDIREIYLDHNQITYIEQSSFSELESLRKVSINYNRLKTLQFIQTHKIHYDIFLGNQFECQCQNFIGPVKHDKLMERIICSNSQSYRVFKTKCELNQTFVMEDVSFSMTGLIGGRYIAIIAAILVGVMGTILIIILTCFFRSKLNLYIHSKYGVRLIKQPLVVESLSDDQLDAHLLFTETDSNFAFTVLGSELKDFGYKIGLSQDEKILELSVSSSKRIIILISLNFLQNYANIKYRTFFQNLINRIQPSIRRLKIIIIIAAPVDIIMSEIYLNTLAHTSFVIFWGEKRFWDKLKFAMPDIKTARRKKTPDDKRVEYTYVTLNRSQGGDGSDSNQFENRLTKNSNHFYSTIGEEQTTNNGRAYFV